MVNGIKLQLVINIMYIQSTEGLAVQASGASESNYGVRRISKSVQFTYAAGLTNILTITASGSAPTNFGVSFIYSMYGENFTNNTNGPQLTSFINGYYLNSSGIFVDGGSSSIYVIGNAWQTTFVDVATARVIKLQAQGNSATNTSMMAVFDVMISCSDFSLLTFS